MPFLGNTTLSDLLQELGHATGRREGRSNVQGTTLLNTLRSRQAMLETVSEQEPASGASAAQESSDHGTSEKGIPSGQSPLANCNYQQAVVWIGMQLADALAYSHMKGILHSDIKPANILLASDGQPRLIDFNVALHRATGTGQEEPAPLGGTIAYMSPEHRQAIQSHGSIDGRSDVYSLGVVLFEMLTGKVPSQLPKADRDSSQALLQVLQRANRKISPALAGIVLRCLQNEPQDRYPSARALCEDLTAQLEDRPLVHLSEPSLGERFQKWMRRHPRLTSSASLGLVATLCMVALGGWIWWRGQALQRVEWQMQLETLRQRIPIATVLLSAKSLAPQLEESALQEFRKSLELLKGRGTRSDVVDPRWKSEPITPLAAEVDSIVGDFLMIASRTEWRQPEEETRRATEQLREQWKQHSKMEKDVPADKHAQIVDAIANGDWALAKSILEGTNERKRSFVEWWLLGDCCFALQDYARSMQCYTTCITLRPDVSIGYYNRAMVHMASQRLDLAVADYEAAAIAKPSLPWAQFNRAIALQQSGRVGEALTTLDRAIEEGLEAVSAYRLRADLYGMQGNLEQQMANMELALKAKPTCDQDWVDRGLIRWGQDPQGAATDFEQAIRMNPRSVDARQKLASLCSEVLGQREAAMKYLEQLIQLAPNQPTHRAGRAVIYARAGEIEKASTDLAVCDGLAPSEPIVLYQMACGHSLLAGILEMRSDEPESKEPLDWHSRQALIRFAQALSADRKLAEIVETDPDIAWLKGTPKYRTIMEAIQYADGASPNAQSR